MHVTRRQWCSILPAALLPAMVSSQASAEQDKAMPSAIYPFEKLPVQTTNNAQIRHVLKGKLATGESLEVHETTLPPGAAPHAPHHHGHSEMCLIREGTVAPTINGTSYIFDSGSVGFLHSNAEHGIKNIATAPAMYFVVAIGPDADVCIAMPLLFQTLEL